jgi:hypothetical protein
MESPEDEAFNEIERQARQRKESVRAAMRSVEEDDDIQDYKRPWVGLTHGEVIDIYEKVMKADVAELVDNFARALEIKLKEKNT